MININDLHKSDNPRLLFMANSLTNKGRSNKSFTIELTVDGYNDTILGGVFTSRAARVVKFDAEYTIGSTTLRGKLLVTTSGKYKAEAIFLTGNGTLWETIGNKNIRDYDWTAWDHQLNLFNVNASETRGNYIYDVVDRGAFAQEFATSAKIDIHERYPALNIQNLITEICNQEGYGVEFSAATGLADLLSSAYLMFTGDKEIRNSNTWLKEAPFSATITSNKNYEESDTGNGSFNIQTIVTQDVENFDNSNQYNTSTYRFTVKEGGTFRFVRDYSFKFYYYSTSAISISNESATIAFFLNGSIFYSEDITLTWGDRLGVYEAYTSGYLDSKWIDLSTGDIIDFRIQYQGDITCSGLWYAGIFDVVNFTTVTGGWDDSYQRIAPVFYNEVTRWYGAGSKVEISKVLPDRPALDLLRDIFNSMNLYAFTDEDQKLLKIRHGRDLIKESRVVTFDQPQEQLNEITNTWLRFQTDKAAALLDPYLDSGGTVDRDFGFPVSQTYVGQCFRLFQEIASEIPVLWDDLQTDPRVWGQRFSPPKYVTKGNMRIMIYTGNTACTGYPLTYGRGFTTNETTRTQYPAFVDCDWIAYHRYDLSQQEITVTGYSRLPMYDLYSQKLFSSPVWLTGYGAGWIEQAEQIRDDVFKVTIKLAVGGYNG